MGDEAEVVQSPFSQIWNVIINHIYIIHISAKEYACLNFKGANIVKISNVNEVPKKSSYFRNVHFSNIIYQEKDSYSFFSMYDRQVQ